MSKTTQKSVSTVLASLGILTTSFAPFALPATTLAQSTFSDVQGNWAQSCITQLTQKGVISGYPDGTFRPSAQVTRAEFAAMIGKAFPSAQPVRSANQFTDVSSSYWAANAISFASQTGFLSGYPGGVFNPSQNIPRAQVLVALASGLNYSPMQTASTTLNANFTDVAAIPTYAQSGIAAATEKRLVVNYPNVKVLNPNQLASRAEVSAFLCQALAGTGQVSSAVPAQYIAGIGSTSSNTPQGQIAVGTTIPVKYTAAQRIIVAPNETAAVTLTVAQDIRNSQGIVAIPAGSQVIGQLQPANGGSQFVASAAVINGQQYALNASSNVIQSTQDVRNPNFLQTLAGAAIGSGAAAIITGVTGDKQITSGNVLLGGSLGAAVAANQGRNIGSTIRDAAIGAAITAGITGLTGDRNITAQTVITGAATAATIGGSLDRTGTSQVIVVNPNSDLTLTVN